MNIENDKPRCQTCGRYCGYGADNGIPYGCTDPGAPEPLDPEYWCKICAKKEYKKALILKEKMYVYWRMPDWQSKALEKLGLVKIDHKLVKKPKNLL